MTKLRSLLFGTTASTFEVAITTLTAIIGTLLVVLFSEPERSSSLLTKMIVAIIAFDLIGGAVSNVTRATSGQYAKISPLQRVAFLVAHVIQPVVYFYILDGSWSSALGLWLYALVAGLLVSLKGGQHSLQLATSLFVMGILAIQTGVSPDLESSWFPTVYPFKLIVGFSVDHSRRQY